MLIKGGGWLLWSLGFFWNILFDEVDDCYTCGHDAPLNEIVLVDHEKHVLFDNYIVEFVHDATENYFQRGKYGCRNFHVSKTPIYMMQVLKVLLFFLPMLDTLCSIDLFS